MTSICLRCLVVVCAVFVLITTASAIETAPADEGKVAYVIRIEGAIERALLTVIKRGLREAKRDGADIVILDLETPGGALEPAIKIAKIIVDLPYDTVAFVNKSAISAGALIALSCKKIVFAPSATIGAAEPIMMVPVGQPQPVSEKIVSYVRAEFRSVAEKNGHPVKIAEAMVDKDKYIPDISEKGELLTLTSEESLKAGLGSAMVESLPDLLAYLGKDDYTVVTVKEFWVEKIARFLAHPAVTSILLMGGLLCIYIAWKTPGLGVPEVGALCCFVLFFGGHTIAGLAGWGTLILFMLGFILLFIEVFVTPGFGVLGTTGIVCIMTSVVLTLLEHPVNSKFFTIADLETPMYILASAILGTFLLGALLATILPKTSVYHKIVLSAVENNKEGFHTTEDKTLELPVGTRGRNLTTLRPAGTAMFDDTRYDVVSENEFIPQGSNIEVLAVEGRRLVVRRVQE